VRTYIRNPIPEVASPTMSDMGRRVAAEDLVGAHEIAERLGVARPQVVHDWRRRHADFPQPIAQLKTALIWDWKEVARWAVKTGRLERTSGDDRSVGRRS
jgi:predicted DNA-binding transcriptional regulator AlpA